MDDNPDNLIQYPNDIGLIQPDVLDEVRWYKIQTFGKWYAVKACCRTCATARLNDWTFQWPSTPELQGEVKTVEIPDWLMHLKD